MKINRQELIDSLYKFACSGNGIITGSPGVGKTYSLNAIAEKLESEGRPFLVIPVDRLGAATQQDVKNAYEIEISLSSKLKQEYFDPTRPGVVIIDGFDAARGYEVQRNIITLIKELIFGLEGGWNIIVSIRSFDARKSKDLIRLFDSHKKVIDGNEDKSISCRNFYIPHLSENEILRVDNFIPGLKTLYSRSSTDFKKVLSVPFNLWLLKQIQLKNNNLSYLDGLVSEVQLLELYWDNYIGSGDDSILKEQFLKEITLEMVKNLTLSVPKHDFLKGTYKNAWTQLFSDQIITDNSYNTQRLAYTHNILFDFAVAKLLMSDNPDNLKDFLTEENGRSLFLRPSLTYHFTMTWFYSTSIFWSSYLKLLLEKDSNLKVFARIVPASIAVRLIKNVEDFNPLLALKNDNLNDFIEATTRIFQAYDLEDMPNSNIWLQFMEILSKDIKNELLWYLANFSNKIYGRDNCLSPTISASCGLISRNLLTWIFENRKKDSTTWIDGVGADFVLATVVSTYITDSRKSHQLIRETLDLIKEKDFPIKYIYRLSDSIDLLFNVDPEISEHIYRVIFGYEEVSKDETSLGTPILPLLSNRKQDYEMCYYHLIRKFPKFLEVNPIIAIRTAIDCVESHIWLEHIQRYKTKEIKIDEITFQFNFRNQKALYLVDHSSIWDSRDSYKEEPIKLGNYIMGFIESNRANSTVLNQVFDLFAQNARSAFWWKRLLAIGASHPEDLHSFLKELCLVDKIIDGMDTEYEAVEFICKAWSFFTKDEKLAIEKTVMTIEPENKESLKYTRELQEKIISRLPEKDLKRKDSKKLSKSISNNKPKANRKPFSLTTSWGSYSDEDFLRDEGANIESDSYKELKSLWQPLSEASSTYLNSTPDEPRSKELLLKLIDLRNKIYPNPITDDKAVLTKAWTEVSSVAEIIARSKIDTDSVEYDELKTTLLLASRREEPQPSEGADERFTSPGYSPLPRNEAAQGLCWLARFKHDDDILNAVQTLISDPVPSVRYLASREIWRAKDTSEDWVWATMLKRASAETNGVVLSSLSYSLGMMLHKNEEKTVQVADILFDKLINFDESRDYAKAILDLVVWLSLDSENKWAMDKLNTVIASPSSNIHILYTLMSDLLGYVLPKVMLERPDLFKKAISQITSFISSLWKCLDVAFDKNTVWTKEKQEELKKYYSPIDNVITRFYFNLETNEKRKKNRKEPIDESQRKVYFQAIEPILSLILDKASLSNSGTLFAPTAHHFMELLVGVVQFDVKIVLRMTAKLLKVSEASGYNLDSMAVREVVNLVEIVLSDHRAELRDSDALNDLLSIIDMFAKTGWKDALKLVWRLDEIYR